MRILQIVQKPQRRGAEIFAFQLTGQFLKQGHDARIIYLYSAQSEQKLPLKNGDTVLGSRENALVEKFPGWNPKIVKQLSNIVKDFQPDVIQLNGARTVKYGTLLRFLNAGRWVLVYRNIGDPNVWLKAGFQRWFYRNFLMTRVDGMVAVSKGSHSTLSSFYQNGQPIVRIPRGVDSAELIPKTSRIEIRQQLKTPEGTPVAIFAGSLTSEKRVDRLLQVVKEIPELHLWILGEGILRHDLEQTTRRLEIEDRVRFAGPQNDVASFLHAADFFVLTSDTEGIPGALLEAAFMGLPSIATKVGGVADCVVDGVTGILVDPDNSTELKEAVVSFIQNAEKRVSMGKNAKTWVAENFCLDKIGHQYLRFYQELITRKNFDSADKNKSAIH